MFRILIDGRFVGVGESQTRYVLELVRNILKLDQKNEYTLLMRPQGEKELKSYPGIKERANLKVKILDIPHYSVAEQTKLLKYLNREKFDLVHFTQFNHPILYRGKHVTTIQDLTMQGHLHRQKLYRRWAFRKVMGTAARNSDEVIAVSKTTRDEVVDFYHVPKEKFTIVYHGLDHERYNMKVKSQKSSIDNFKKKYKIDGDYFLYTGMWKRHKNLKRMLLSFEKFLINSQNPNVKIPQLVLVGKIDAKEPEIIAEIDRINKIINTKHKIQNSIITTGFIEEEELPIAYAGAFTYIIPSLSEGFGWPPLEAMACGTPVIASNASCIPEILGDSALFFDPYEADDIAAKMADISRDGALRSDLIKKGLEQVQKYTWDKAAKKTLEVYKKVLDR